MVESPAGDDEEVIEETFPTARVLCVETQHLAGVVDKMPPDARFWGEKVAQLCIHQPRAEDLSDVGVSRSGSRAAGVPQYRSSPVRAGRGSCREPEWFSSAIRSGSSFQRSLMSKPFSEMASIVRAGTWSNARRASGRFLDRAAGREVWREGDCWRRAHLDWSPRRSPSL
jgi:hypothetical protein